MKKKIKKYLYPLQLKVSTEKFINLFIFYLMLTSCLCLIILTYNKFFEIKNYLDILVKAFYLSASCFIIHLIKIFQGFKNIVKIADKLYFKERLLTAIEFENSDSIANQAQREDTIKMMQKIRVEKLYKIHIKRNFILAACVLIVLNLGVNYIETEQGIKNYISYQNIKEIIDENNLLKKALKNELIKTNLSQDKINNLLENLEKNMQDVENKQDALKALSITKNDLKDLTKLAKTLDENDIKNIESALQKIDQSAKKLANQTISDYAFKTENNTDEKNFDNKISNTDISEIAKNMNDTNSTGLESPEHAKEISSTSSNNNDSNNNNSNNNDSNNTNNSDKTKNLSQSKDIKASKIGGRGLGSVKTEIIINPKRLNTRAEMKFVPSQKSGESNDSSYRRAKNNPQDAGDFVNYKELFINYKNEAEYTSKELDIPNNMHDIINAYFDSIQE